MARAEVIRIDKLVETCQDDHKKLVDKTDGKYNAILLLGISNLVALVSVLVTYIFTR